MGFRLDRHRRDRRSRGRSDRRGVDSHRQMMFGSMRVVRAPQLTASCRAGRPGFRPWKGRSDWPGIERSDIPGADDVEIIPTPDGVAAPPLACLADFRRRADRAAGIPPGCNSGFDLRPGISLRSIPG
jgi:hypothetical protein